MYMAVSPDAVSSGHGQQMFHEVIRRLRMDDASPRLLLFEVQKPKVAGRSSTRFQDAGRRLSFYRRLGARILAGVDYVQRIPGQPGVPMHLMHLPLTTSSRAGEALLAAKSLFGADAQIRGRSTTGA
jgi:hypothetical protein